MTEPRRATAIEKTRIEGVDAARGVALIGMMAVHVFNIFDWDGTPTAATVVAAGRSAATFALVAGISLAFISGGSRPLDGRARTAVAASIAVRALLIATIGFALGYAADDAEVILPYYAVLFLFAIPLLGLRPRTLAGVAAASIVIGPLLVMMTFSSDFPFTNPAGNPTFGSLVDDLSGVIAALLLTGFYPAVAYLAYVSAGLAIGRLDLTSPRVARRLIGGGLALALGAWFASSLLLFRLGGLRYLYEAGKYDEGLAGATSQILWGQPEQTLSWWWLAVRAPHTTSSIDMIHTLGSALAVLGASLLLMRIPVVARLLRPIATAGTMTLTLYSGHLLVLATGLLREQPVMQYLLLVCTALLFAVLWRRWVGQGPLEKLVSAAAARARQSVLGACGGEGTHRRVVRDRESALR
jgi:uncharacterized membrane protein YeiB